MNSYIYLDHAATTPVAPEVVQAMHEALAQHFGNPSSSHSLGIEAAAAILKARRTLAGLLDCSPEEIFFTGGGSEADNLALFGAAYAGRKKSLVVSAIEHPAVIEAARELERRGFSLSIAPVDRHGLVIEDRLLELVSDDTFLVSIMAANNEIGTVQPVKQLARAVKRKAPEALFHTDAVQFFGKERLSLADGALDLVSLAAHKINGPKGVGALVVKKGTKIRALVHGGGQEQGLRAGTENTPGIVGFAEAAALMFRSFDADCSHVETVMAGIRGILEQGIPGLVVNGHPEHRLPNILSIGVPGIKSQNMVNFLEDEGVIVSAGSACHSTRTKRSPVIEAIGLPPEYATIRISASRYTDPAEAEAAAHRIVAVVCKLRG